MSKHTNGLQILKPNKSFVAVGPEGGLATAMFIAGAGKPPNEETLANARLYVAAPAMLAAIKTAEEALSEILDNRTHLDLDRLDRKMLENARAELQGAMKESVMRKRIQWIGDLEICHNPKADPHMAYEIFTSCHLIGAFSTLERAIAYAEGKARQGKGRCVMIPISEEGMKDAMRFARIAYKKTGKTQQIVLSTNNLHETNWRLQDATDDWFAPGEISVCFVGHVSA